MVASFSQTLANRSICVAFILVLSLENQPAFGTQDDQQNESQSAIDEAMGQLMQTCDATAATIAIGRGDSIVFQKGYGFSDRRRKTPTKPDATMRVASCTKPITRTVVELLIRQGKLERDTLIFDYLGIQPGEGGLNDERIRLITIEHLMKHEGGWDRDATFDPLFITDQIAQEIKVGNVEKNHIVRYMWSKPLQCDPGTENHYSNFGYLLLGLAIEKATGKSWINSVREMVGTPLGVDDFSLSSTSASARALSEVTYERESNINSRIRDSTDGLTTSAPTLCKFMSEYWLDGVPRGDFRSIYLYYFGTHPFTTTAIMEQRLDGLHYAILFNSRREERFMADNEKIREQFNLVLDAVGGKLGD
jgi:CubicO group peptidase (beta-lactamase class C family)